MVYKVTFLPNEVVHMMWSCRIILSIDAVAVFMQSHSMVCIMESSTDVFRMCPCNDNRQLLVVIFNFLTNSSWHNCWHSC